MSDSGTEESTERWCLLVWELNTQHTRTQQNCNSKPGINHHETLLFTASITKRKEKSKEVNHSSHWVNSKIVLIAIRDKNMFLLHASPLKFLSALNLLIIVIAQIIMLINAKPQSTKKQKQESKPHSQFLLNSQINSYSLFSASTLLCCIVCASFCVPVIMQNGSLSSVGHLFCRLGGYEEQKELWSCESL